MNRTATNRTREQLELERLKLLAALAQLPLSNEGAAPAARVATAA
jgi:hypothetical protein